MSVQREEDDGLNAARGILLAVGLSLVFWAAVIGAYCLGRSVPDAPPEHSRSAQASEVA